MQRIRDLWATDRGRLAHYVVAVSLAIFLLCEYATLKDVAGQPPDNPPWMMALAVVATIALLFTRRYTFVAPLVAAIALAATLPLMDTYIAQDSDAPS